MAEEEKTYNRTARRTTHAVIGMRTAKTADNPHGFVHVRGISADKTALLVLGGEGTVTDEAANGYLSAMEKILNSHGVKADLYACVYDFGEPYGGNAFRLDCAGAEQMRKYGRRTDLLDRNEYTLRVLGRANYETMNPTYVKELFETAFMPRISDGLGDRLPFDDACKRIRNLTVVAHCLGGYTFLKLEEMMRQKTAELGYTEKERAALQSQVLCTAYAPYAPLGVAKSTVISFVSAKDSKVTHGNNFETEIRALAESGSLPPCYFPGNRGEFFLAPSFAAANNGHPAFWTDTEREHNFSGAADGDGYSRTGKLILGLSANIIANSVRHAGQPLPSVKNLACGGDARLESLFEGLKENGVSVWKQACFNANLRLRQRCRGGY